MTRATAPGSTSVRRPNVALAVVPLINLNPFDWLGDQAKEGLADGWTAVMISVWSAGLWLLESAFTLLDRFLTPDLTDPGLGVLHGTTLWISLAVALLIGLAQTGVAAVRRDGTSLATLLVGLAQYGAVATCWVAVFALLVLASAGLTGGLLEVLLGVDDFAGFPADAGWPDQVGSAVGATVLGLCSLFLLIPAGFGYLLIMLVREATLLILTATAPIAAAGALGLGTRAWLWKSLRWFLAACLTAPLLALVLGLGVQITRAAFPDQNPPTGTGNHQVLPDTDAAAGASPDPDVAPHGSQADSQAASSGESPQEAQASQVGMAVVGAAIMVVGCFCPMALFRLLAFVDPGTGSGASLRSTLSANGGLGSLGGLAGRGSAEASGSDSGAATATAPDGRAASEASADAETSNRFQAAAARAVPVAGRTAAGTMRLLGGLARHAAATGVDVASQAGIGSAGYYDTSAGPPSGTRGSPRRADRRSTDQTADPSAPQPDPTTATQPNPESNPRPAPVSGSHDLQPTELPTHDPAPHGPATTDGSRGTRGTAGTGGQGGAAGAADDAAFLA